MIRLNLLPKNLRRRVEPGWWRLAAAAVVLAVLGTVGFIHFSTLSKVRALENQRDQLQVEVNVLQDSIAEQNRLNQQQKDLENLLTVRNQLKGRYVPWSNNLNQFFRQTPGIASTAPDLALKTISTKALSSQETQTSTQSGAYDGKPINVEFNIQGQTRSYAALVRFINAFENSPNFGINLQQTQLDQESGFYSFGATVGLVAQNETANNPGGASGSATR